MTANETVAAHLSRSDRGAEVEQATIRLVIGILAVAYSLGAVLSGRVQAPLSQVIAVCGIFLAAAVIIRIRVQTRGSMATRLVGMFLDIGILSYLISILKEPGFLLLPIYLWVIVGNGLRYGLPYLLVATGVSLLCLAGVFAYQQVWLNNLYMAVGWQVALLVLPAYFSVLLRRLQKQASELERMSRHMEMLAKHDSLTSLPNRSAFYERIKLEMTRADTQGSAFAMAFVDLDGFKAVNDDYGHDVGDEVIKSVARRITESVRTDDFVARLGGDEFVVLLACQNAGQINVSKVVQKILSSLTQQMDAGGRAIALSASIGVAFYPRDGHDLESLLRCADSEMYNVKRAGKNGFRIATG